LKPSRLSSAPTRKRAPEKREGIVVLIVMMMLIMATGTAVFAIQSTQYEQRSASAIAEANWARGLAECTTMAGIALAEDRSAAPPSTPLGAQWLPNGTARPVFSDKYGIPAPNAADPTTISRALVNGAQPFADVSPYANNTPGGLLAGFLPTQRGPGSLQYPLYQNRDSQFAVSPGLHYFQAHWLQEAIRVPLRGNMWRTRTVVTGFAEVRVWGDPLDSSNVRELHELDTISRGYIDTIE